MFNNIQVPREVGFVLSIDPATKAGFALFDLKTHELIDTLTVCCDPKSTWGTRVNYIMSEVREYFKEYIPDIKYIIFESNKMSSALLNGLAVSVMGVAPLAKVSDALCGVSPSSWKAWVRRESGLPIAKPKGLEALALVRPEYVEMCDSEDSADACLIALWWLNTKKPKNW